jgi:hypothetical protein
MAKLSGIVLLSVWSYAALSFAVSGAAEAQQREARLLKGFLDDRPATLASCDQAKYGVCLEEANTFCRQMTNSGGAAATCIQEKMQQCKSQFGC